MDKRALIVGASGVIGNALAGQLVADGWQVHGLARGRTPLPAGCTPIRVDLTAPAEVAAALAGVQVSHVFISAWARQDNEQENIRVNGGMVKSVLDGLRPASRLQHVSLVTGLKHYLGPFEAYATGKMPSTPFREEQGRLDIPNFYYAQEDELFQAAARDGFGWSVHRPHTVIGFAIGNAMNMGMTLAVYATLCKETGQPFVFPGSAAQWHGLTDMTEANLLARHMLWAATSPNGRDQAFNVVNGDVFRWQWMWSQLAAYFGVEAAPFDGTVRPLEAQMQGSDDTWRTLAERHQLRESDLGKLSSPWHTDADLGRPVEVLADMGKSRKAGFLEYQDTLQAFITLFDRLKAERIIPA